MSVPRFDPARVAETIRDVAAVEVLPRFRALAAHEVREKKPGDFVTVADREAETALIAGLQAIIPSSTVIGEEMCHGRPELLNDLHMIDGPLWFVDPLDGTHNFMEGHTRFAIMVALRQRRETVGAWILKPADGSLAIAERGAGAFIDGQRIQTPDGGKDASALRGTILTRFLPPELRDMSAIQNAAERIKNEYFIPATSPTTTPSAIVGPTGQPASVTVTPGTPAAALKIDIDRLQKNLSAWGEAVYSGKADFGKGNIFEGVAPGQVKGAAISVLNGFRDALDQAIQQGVPGADKLKSARDKFSANIKAIEQYSNYPIVQKFDVKYATDLTPEIALNYIKNAPPSQRAIMIDVLQNSPNANVQGVLDTIRRTTFNDILEKAAVKGGAEMSPTFAIDSALKELDRRKGSLGQLFSSAADLKEAELAMKTMRRIVQTESPGAVGGPSASAAYTAARATGGSAAAALSIRDFVYPLLRDVIASPEAFAKVIYQPDNRKLLLELAKPKTTLDKAWSITKTLGKAAGITTARGYPMMETTQPQEDRMLPAVEVTATPEEASYEDLLREAQSRGLPVD